MRKQYFIFSLLILFSPAGFSQSKSKYELIAGIGPTGFLGDLGGANMDGTHLIGDYNFLATRYCINAGFRYKVSPKLAFKSMLSFARVSGNDAFSHDVIRKNRNLNFRSPIIEVSVQAEYYLISETNRSQYSPNGFKLTKRKKATLYLFGGIGLFYYNPQEKLADGHWYTVKNYNVEGQGLPGGPKQFSNYSIAIPMGMGLKKNLSNKWSIGTELGVRKTFTDYIDGVSGNYYDKTKIMQAYGPTAVALADPNLGKIDGATITGQQRGNSKYKDCYIFLTLNISYKIPTKKHRSRSRF
jgi:hypothetical protein